VLVLFATFTQGIFPPAVGEGTNACFTQVNDKLVRCLAGANGLPFGLDIAARALCHSEELLGLAGCVFAGAP
ncbi:MAG: hypothetical protein ABI882_20570, partial [Acidobacteriota bacterium]